MKRFTVLGHSLWGPTQANTWLSVAGHFARMDDARLAKGVTDFRPPFEGRRRQTLWGAQVEAGPPCVNVGGSTPLRLGDIPRAGRQNSAGRHSGPTRSAHRGLSLLRTARHGDKR